MASPTKRFERKEIDRLIWPIVEQLDWAQITFEICGSYRRGKATSKDVDILIQGKSLTELKIPQMMEQFHRGQDVRWQGEKKMSFFFGELPIDIKAMSAESWGAGLLHHTGNDIFNMICRSRIKKQNMLLNEYGVWTREDNPAERTSLCDASTEENVLKMIFEPNDVIKYLEPRNRELEDWRNKK